GSSTVSGSVGASGALLKEINAGANGSSSTFSSDVYATNLDVEGTGTVNLNGDYTGTAIRYNADGTVVLANGSDVNSAITTGTTNTGTLTLNGSSTVSGSVGASGALLKEINAGANGSSSTFSSDVYATNLDVEGTGTVNLNGDYTGTAIRYNADGTVVLANGSDVNSAITTGTTNTGTLTLNGSSTVSGSVGASGALLKEINAGANGSSSTFSSDVYATTTNIGAGEIKFVSDVSTDIVALSTTQGVVTFVGDGSGKSQAFTGDIGTAGSLINTLNIGESGTANYSTTTITGNVYATNTVLDNGTSSSTLILSDGSNITSTIKTAQNGQGVLTFLGNSTVNGTIGTNTEKLEQINVANTGKTVTFNSSINSNNLNILGDGEVILADNSNLNAPVTTTTNNEGTLTFEGTSNVSGQIGTSGALLKEITLQGSSGEVVTFGNDVYVSNIVFESDGTANLDGNLTGNINFSGIDAIINIADGKGILDSGGGLLGSVQTLANNTGILNYKGDGVIDGIIGSSGLGINELNVNTNDEQDKDGSGTVTSNGLLARREIFADIINLYNNATLTLADNTNVTNTDTSDSLIIATMTSNTGNVVFQGSSTVSGDVGTSTNNLESITAGVSGETVTFDGMVYATNLKYTDNGTVILNGDNGSNVEGMKGTVDFDSFAGTLEIGDDVNLTTGTSGIQFANANNAILTFNGTSTIYGVLGGNTAGNSTFESIYAGVTAETVTFKNDVYVKESTFHVSEDGVVNFEGNLYGDLVFENDGTVNVANTKSIIVSSTPLAITTANNGQGTINFEGTTTLYTDIGEDLFRLKEVNFGTVGTASNSYTQNINKDIYANDITIGNSSNKTTANLTSDMTFYGNLNLSSNSVLDVNNNDITVEDEIVLASNSTLKFEIDTSDLIAGQAVANDTSGSIDANSLNIQDDIKVHIDYNGTLAGKYEYSLIDANSSTGTYTEGTEANGKVSDNSIIDSKVILKDNNLVLVADRTNNGSFNPEDLYIEKSEIGEDYSNAASQALADYANGVDRAGALAQIINELEYLEGGTVLSEAKKQEMIETQRKLAPIANSSNMQTSITASNLAMTTIKGRLSDIRTGEMNNFTPTLYRTGLSSGDYYSFDTSFWLKGMAGKATQDQVDEYYGFDTSTYGFVGGMDKISGDGTIFGAALAYSTTKTNQENAASDSSDTTSIQGTIYSSLAYENAYVDSYLSYAKHKTDGTRTANSGKLTSSVDAEQISAKVETGYTIPVNDGVSLTPFASLEYSLLNQKGYTEKGTAYQNDALKVDSLKLNRGTVELGAKLTSNIELEETLIIPQLSVSAYNSFGDNSADIKAQYIGGGKEFVTPVSELNKTMYNVGLGLETKISDSTSVIFDMDYDRSKDGKFQGYSGSVTFGISF
ncbi:MAG: autotransporter domain-containing protein, partial [Arcobacter sp.]|uniref:autotransporter domain-containing protein n=1 Tax=Arcobacter sp. TaxID=1872629 RepID=UPI003D021F87